MGGFFAAMTNFIELHKSILVAITKFIEPQPMGAVALILAWMAFNFAGDYRKNR
jgi:hypothetical protein